MSNTNFKVENSENEKIISSKSEYGTIQSVSDAKNKLEKWDINNKDTEGLPNYIISCVYDDKNYIHGDSDDYHNLSSEFARKSLYPHATSIALRGIEKYVNNVDLHADVIKFGSKCQQWDKCKCSYEKLKSIEYEKWSWRTFTFVIDYLFEMMEIENDSSTKINEIVELIANYKSMKDERAWVAEADLFRKLGKSEKAIEALKEGVKSVVVAPQCCIKLADMLLKIGKYAEVIKYATIGLRSTAQEQPTASNGYLFYVSALAKDALIHEEEFENHQSNENNNDKGFKNMSKVKDALLDYQMAKRLLGDGTYIRNTMQREMILKAKSGIEEDDKNNELIKKLLASRISEISDDSD